MKDRKNETNASRPERTCVVCRGASEQAGLLRFVLARDGQEVVLDKSRCAGGRGAYCHSGRCFEDPQRDKLLLRSILKVRRRTKG